MTNAQLEAERRAGIMLAYANGAKIEYRSNTYPTWEMCISAPAWAWDDGFNYRVATEKLATVFHCWPRKWLYAAKKAGLCTETSECEYQFDSIAMRDKIEQFAVLITQADLPNNILGGQTND